MSGLNPRPMLSDTYSITRPRRSALSSYPLPIEGSWRSRIRSRLDSSKVHQYKYDIVTISNIYRSFGTYRKMYRSQMRIYILPFYIPSSIANKRSSVIPLTLGPFGASHNDSLSHLDYLSELDKGTDTIKCPQSPSSARVAHIK